MMNFYEVIGVESLEQMVSFAVRLVLAAFCGALIGLERERRRRPAGLRTHMLVCLGAALVMIIGEQLQYTYMGSDVARLGAQVISGIGFLGAGTILVDRHDRIRGLTTAAGLWTSACIGLAIGAGYYYGGILACLLTLVIVALFRSVEKRFSKKSRILDIYVECTSVNAVYDFIAHIAASECRVVSFKLTEQFDEEGGTGSDVAGANLSIMLPGFVEHHSILQNLRGFDGLISVREI